MKSVFNPQDVEEIIDRINKLTPETQRLWGKMSVSQMLAHCNVAYEVVYESKHPKPNPIFKFIATTFIKKHLVNEVPYPKSTRTAPVFIVSDDKDFSKEKDRLIGFIRKTLELGESHFENKESYSVGRLTAQEWNNMFYKHLDHHFKQFGV